MSLNSTAEKKFTRFSCCYFQSKEREIIVIKIVHRKMEFEVFVLHLSVIAMMNEEIQINSENCSSAPIEWLFPLF